MAKKPKTPTFKTDIQEEKTAQKDLNKWMKEMAIWGKKVRLDIIRLEGAAGFPPTKEGDPGDPPDDPWNDE